MDTKNWKWNEMQQIGADYNNPEEVRIYEERMSKLRNFPAECEEIITKTRIKKSDTFLELGCGTAILSRTAAPLCTQVIAVDISKSMLSYAEDKARNEDLTNIMFINSGFLNYNHQGPLVDAAASQLALHHLPDFWKLIALSNIASCINKGGRFFLRDVVFTTTLEKYEKQISWAISNMQEKAGKEMAEGYARHIKHEYSTYDWVMEEMFFRAGFSLEEADYNEDFIATYIAVKD